ncbi:hypothetical protein YC2023_040508 [Brassica napus]
MNLQHALSALSSLLVQIGIKLVKLVLFAPNKSQEFLMCHVVTVPKVTNISSYSAITGRSCSSCCPSALTIEMVVKNLYVLVSHNSSVCSMHALTTSICSSNRNSCHQAIQHYLMP